MASQAHTTAAIQGLLSEQAASLKLLERFKSTLDGIFEPSAPSSSSMVSRVQAILASAPQLTEPLEKTVRIDDYRPALSATQLRQFEETIRAYALQADAAEHRAVELEQRAALAERSEQLSDITHTAEMQRLKQKAMRARQLAEKAEEKARHDALQQSAQTAERLNAEARAAQQRAAVAERQAAVVHAHHKALAHEAWSDMSGSVRMAVSLASHAAATHVEASEALRREAAAALEHAALTHQRSEAAKAESDFESMHRHVKMTAALKEEAKAAAAQALEVERQLAAAKAQDKWSDLKLNVHIAASLASSATARTKQLAKQVKAMARWGMLQKRVRVAGAMAAQAAAAHARANEAQELADAAKASEQWSVMQSSLQMAAALKSEASAARQQAAQVQRQTDTQWADMRSNVQMAASLAAAATSRVAELKTSRQATQKWSVLERSVRTAAAMQAHLKGQASEAFAEAAEAKAKEASQLRQQESLDTDTEYDSDDSDDGGEWFQPMVLAESHTLGHAPSKMTTAVLASLSAVRIEASSKESELDADDVVQFISESTGASLGSAAPPTAYPRRLHAALSAVRFAVKAKMITSEKVAKLMERDRAVPAQVKVLTKPVESQFLEFCDHGSQMTSRGFAQLCRDCELFGKGFKKTNADIAFCKVTAKHQKTVGLKVFAEQLLPIVAAQREMTLSKVVEAVQRCKGKHRQSTSTITSGNVFDRMTNTTKYTGMHKERFDADGNGRGAAGRDLGSKGLGTQGKQQDLSQMVRPGLNSKTPHPPQPHAPQRPTHSAEAVDSDDEDEQDQIHVRQQVPQAKLGNAPVNHTPSGNNKVSQRPTVHAPVRADGQGRGPTQGNVFDRITDTSKYTGMHKERFDADGNGRGAAGRDLGSKGQGSGGAANDLSQIVRRSGPSVDFRDQLGTAGYNPVPDQYGLDDEYLDSGNGLAMLHSTKARHRGAPIHRKASSSHTAHNYVY